MRNSSFLWSLSFFVWLVISADACACGIRFAAYASASCPQYSYASYSASSCYPVSSGIYASSYSFPTTRYSWSGNCCIPSCGYSWYNPCYSGSYSYSGCHVPACGGGVISCNDPCSKTPKIEETPNSHSPSKQDLIGPMRDPLPTTRDPKEPKETKDPKKTVPPPVNPMFPELKTPDEVLQDTKTKRVSAAPAPTIEIFPAARNPDEPRTEIVSIGFFNLTGRDIEFEVSNKQYRLARGHTLSLTLPREFTWREKDGELRTSRVPEDAAGLEIVWQRPKS